MDEQLKKQADLALAGRQAEIEQLAEQLKPHLDVVHTIGMHGTEKAAEMFNAEAVEAAVKAGSLFAYLTIRHQAHRAQFDEIVAEHGGEGDDVEG